MTDLALRPRRRALSLTSLIDVIFLLLMFFMLSSTFVRHGELDLTEGGAGAAGTPSAPVFVQLDPESLRLNGDAVALDDLRALLEGRAQPQTQVLIALAEGVGAQRLVDVLTRLQGAPFAVRVLG